MQVGLFNTKDNLPSDSHSIEEVVDEAHIVDEGVHVAGAQHKQGGQALRRKKKEERRVRSRKFDNLWLVYLCITRDRT